MSRSETVSKSETAGKSETATAGLDFIREIVTADQDAGRRGGRVHTRFPPEPNGYLHIGHAKAICLNFGIAQEFRGLCNLRMDDTNPETEDIEFVRAIETDVRWLGFDWETRSYYASDYFERLFECAVALVRKGLAYVDDLTGDEVSRYRGGGTSRVATAPTATARSTRTSTCSHGCGPASSRTGHGRSGRRSTWRRPT